MDYTNIYIIILVMEEHGFRTGISNENAAFRLKDSILKHTDQKTHVGGLFCDLAQALYCIYHEILLAKLHFYGIHRVSEDWFRSHLYNRRQKVEKNSPKQLRIFSVTGVH